MKSIKLVVLSMSLLPDGGAAIITQKGSTNPSPNGVHKVNQAQLARIATRAIGVNSPVALKHLVDLGGCTLSIDSEDCKAGDAFTNKTTGETGTYTKSWTKYSNHEIKLSFAGSMKLVEVSLSNANFNAQPIAKAEKPVAIVDAEKPDADEPNV